jgi:hypothetical protein
MPRGHAHEAPAQIQDAIVQRSPTALRGIRRSRTAARVRCGRLHGHGEVTAGLGEVVASDMDSIEAGQLCEKLLKLVELGPGKDPDGLREALGLVSRLKQAAAPYPHDKLTAIEKDLPQWFSVRRWRSDTDVTGWHLRQYLRSDINMVRRSWGMPQLPSDGS